MRSIFWKLFLSYLGITLFAFSVLGGVFAMRLATRAFLPGERQLEAMAEKLARLAAKARTSHEEHLLVSALDVLSSRPGPEIVIADLEGRVLCATLPRAAWSRSAVDKEIIAEAIRSGKDRGFGTRDAFPRKTWFVAVPVIVDGAPAGIVHVSFPQRVSGQVTQAVMALLVRSILLALGLAALLILALSYHLTRPLGEIRTMCARIAAGNYSARLAEDRRDEIGMLARTMNFMASRIEESQRHSREFFTNISHELKTPLSSIQGHAEALLDGVTTSPEQSRSYIEIIHRESVRMAKLTADLLDIARFEDGGMALSKETVDLSVLADEVVEGLRLEARKRGVTLHQQVGRGTPEIGADGARLHQVLSNLVENAVKYGGENGEVWIDAEADGKGVRLLVRDNGPGIPGEELPRIFERFYRLEKSRSRSAGGSGLGLPLSRLLVEAHGGTLTVKSAPGAGTTFTIALPLR